MDLMTVKSAVPSFHHLRPLQYGALCVGSMTVEAGNKVGLASFFFFRAKSKHHLKMWQF